MTEARRPEGVVVGSRSMTGNIDSDAKTPRIRRILAAIHSFPEMGKQPQQEDDMKSLLLGSAASMLVASLAFAQQPVAASHPAAPGAMLLSGSTV